MRLFEQTEKMKNFYEFGLSEQLIKNYEELKRVCEEMELNLKNLTNFQTTRFSNSVRFVFINLRLDYPAVKESVKNVIAIKENSSDGEK